MKTSRILLLALIAITSGGCASHAVTHRDDPMAATSQDVFAGRSVPAAQPVALTEERNRSDQDDDARAARPIVPDPWERFNRKVHGFNNVADECVLRPIATGYDKIMPAPVKASVSRFFVNLGMPVTAANQALQGRPGDAVQSLGRFALNTTVGIAGVFDPASRIGMPLHDDEDFGQTLATWGWRDSRYVVVPLLGPRTLRDTVAIVGDQPLAPIGQIQDSGVAGGLQLLEVVDGRVGMLPFDTLRREAIDDYLFVRAAWVQRRKRKIGQESSGTDE